jgi:hypothetical protein
MSLCFAPACISSDIQVFQTIEDIRTLNPVVALLELIECLLNHLDIYNKVPPTAAITGIVVKTLVELLSILARATNLINEGRPGAFSSLTFYLTQCNVEKMVRTLSGWKYNEMVLERLDQLTLDEARTIAARILEVVYGLVLQMKGGQIDSTSLLLAVEFPSL